MGFDGRISERVELAGCIGGAERYANMDLVESVGLSNRNSGLCMTKTSEVFLKLEGVTYGDIALGAALSGSFLWRTML